LDDALEKEEAWPRLAVHHGIGRWLGGEFCEKIKFVVFEI